MNTRNPFTVATTASTALTGLMDGNAVSGSKVEAAIKTIKTAGAKLDNQIHATAVACIYLSMSIAEGGPASGAGPAERLMNAMPKGSRSKALAAWFQAFSNVHLTLDPKKGWVGKVIPADHKLYAMPQPNEAMQKPFWSVEEGNVDPKAFTLGAALAALLKKAQAAADAGQLSDDDKEVVALLTGNAKVRRAVNAAKETAK